MKYKNYLLVAGDILFFVWYIFNADKVINVAKWLNSNTIALVITAFAVLVIRVIATFYDGRLKQQRWQREAQMTNLQPELNKILNSETHKKYLAINQVQPPFANMVTIMAIQIPLLMVVYAIAHNLNGSIFGLPMAKPNIYLAMLASLLYLLVPKYTDWTMPHAQRMYMPMVAYLAGTSTNVMVTLYLMAGAVVFLVMGHRFKVPPIKQTADQFIAENPDALLDKQKPVLHVTGKQARLWLITFQRTIRWGFLLETMSVVFVSAWASHSYYPFVFVGALFVYDWVFPDKHYTWFN